MLPYVSNTVGLAGSLAVVAIARIGIACDFAIFDRDAWVADFERLEELLGSLGKVEQTR